MKESYECEVCGVVSQTRDGLCQPVAQEDIHDYCGTTRGYAALCNGVKQNLPIVCGSCGRPAKQAGLVCNPLLLG